MNPTFTVSIDLAKRKTSVTGLVAVGEKVDVIISGIDLSTIPEWEAENDEGFIGPALRFRLVTSTGKDLVRFPLADGDKWTIEGDSLSAEVDFNTMQLREWLCGFPINEKAEVGIIVDSVVDAMEYGRGTVKILQWAASPAEDPTILPDWRKTLRNLNAAIIEISSKTERAESAAQTAKSARDDAQISKESAETAANNALSSENAAKGFKNDAESASARASTSAEEAKASQTAAESAKSAAETARDEAREYAESAADTLANAATKAELQSEVERATAAERDNALVIDEVSKTLMEEMDRAKAADKNLESQITGIGNKVDDIVANDKGKSARDIAAEEVAKVVANAPADFNTLKEIADYIESDKTGAAQMVTQIDANAKAISAEIARAEGAEAALDGRVKELEKNPSVDVVAPSAEGAGKAADAKAVYDGLCGKQDKLIAGSHIDIAEDGTINTLGYKLVELPAGETQLQDRANIHITEDNVIRTWAASSSYVDDGPYDVDWVHKEVHDIGDGSGELEWYVARFGLVPGFYYPIVPVKDVKADSRYYINYDSQPIPDDPSYGEYKGIISEVSFIPRRISSGSADYKTTIYVDFKTKRPDTGEEITWKIDAYDACASIYDGSIYLSGDYMYLEFGDDYTPPEWDEEDYNLTWRFEVSGLSELPKPGDTLKISLELYNSSDDSTFATYEGEITMPEDLDWRLENASDLEFVGDATIKYSTPDGETKEVVADYLYFSIDGDSWSSFDINLSTGVSGVFPGVSLEYAQWKSGDSDEYTRPITLGKEIVFSPSESTDESSGYSEYFDTKLRLTESFTFTPPAPSFENRARDFLLCVDLVKDRQIELQDVTEVEEGLFALMAGRTLISVTEPIEGKLYASTRPLPTENA